MLTHPIRPMWNVAQLPYCGPRAAMHGLIILPPYKKHTPPIDSPTTLWHVLHVEPVQSPTSIRLPGDAREKKNTHSETCVPYRLFVLMRNELRPLPPGLSMVVSSARRMKLSPFAKASPRLSASSLVTKLLRATDISNPPERAVGEGTLTRARASDQTAKKTKTRRERRRLGKCRRHCMLLHARRQLLGVWPRRLEVLVWPS